MLRILLAEDDVNHATLARQALEGEGHQIITAPDVIDLLMGAKGSLQVA